MLDMKHHCAILGLMVLVTISCDDRTKTIVSQANDSVSFVGCWRSDAKNIVYNNRKLFENYGRDILNKKGVPYDEGDLQIVLSSMDLSKFKDMMALQIYENGQARVYTEGGIHISDGKWVKEGGSDYLLSNLGKVKLYNTFGGLQLDYVVQGETMRIDLVKDDGLGIVRMLIFKGRSCYNNSRFEDSVKYLTQALEYKVGKETPEYSDVIYYLGYAYKKIGKVDKSIAFFEEYLTLHPGKDSIYNKLAWTYATSSRGEIRNGNRAVEYAKKACELTKYTSPSYLDTLAAAYAECGEFESSIKYEKIAIKLSDVPDDTKEFQERLRLFEIGSPFRKDE